MRHHLPLLVLLPLLAGSAFAQRSTFVPDSSLGGGSGNVIPFGHVKINHTTWRNQKYQTIVPAATLGTKPGIICELAFVPRTTGTRQFASIKIQMVQTKLGKLSQNFAFNLGSGAVTVLDARNYVWTNSQIAWTRIGLQKPFLFLPSRGDVVLDIEVRGAGMPNSTGPHPGFRSVRQVRLFAVGWGNNPPATGNLSSSSGLAMEFCFDTNDAHRFGRGCKGSNNRVPALSFTGTAKLGNTLNVHLANALATRPALFVLGISNAAPFPLDLAALGAPGCQLYQSLDFVLPTLTSASGTARVPLAIPNNASLVCAKLYLQFFPQDPTANALNLTASNYGRALLGH